MKQLILLAVTASILIAPMAHADYYITGTIAQTTPDDNAFKSDTGMRLGFGKHINKNFSVELSYGKLGSFSAKDDAAEEIRAESEYIVQQAFPDASLSLQDLSVSVDTTAFELTAIGRLPLSKKASLFAKLALIRWDYTLDTSGTLIIDGATQSFSDSSVSDTGTDIAAGIGAEMAFTDAFSGHLELSQYDMDGLKIRLAGLGLSYKF